MVTEPRRMRPPSDRTIADTHRISVVIPVYNGAALLRETLQSVRDQTSAPGEVIVVDDGSTDDSGAIAASFGFTVIRQENRGLSAARNAGTRAATGEYVAYLDGDDLWSPDKLEVQFAALCAQGEAAFSFTDFRMFDEAGVDERYGTVTHPAFRQTVGRLGTRAEVRIAASATRPVLPDDYILPSSTIVRRADVLAIGGFDETLRISEDHEFFLRLFRIVPAVGVLRPLVLYRRHASQISAKPIALVNAWFEIKRRVDAAPERYPLGDVRYFATAAYVRHTRIAVLQFRLGNFEDAARAFDESLRTHWSVAAFAGGTMTRIAASGAGRPVFFAIRTLMRGWRSRSGARR